MNDLYDTVR